MDWFSDIFSTAQQWLFEAAVQPAMFALGMGNLLEDGYDATAWFMVGVLQVLILLAIIGPLQRWRPVEPVTDRATIRTDVLYTLIHRLDFSVSRCSSRWTHGLTKPSARCAPPATAPSTSTSSGPASPTTRSSAC